MCVLCEVLRIIRMNKFPSHFNNPIYFIFKYSKMCETEIYTFFFRILGLNSLVGIGSDFNWFVPPAKKNVDFIYLSKLIGFWVSAECCQFEVHVSISSSNKIMK